MRCGILVHEMARHTTFKFCLDPTVEQQQVLARHAGASRFAFNQCLRIVKTALTVRKSDPTIDVPWTGFDLINTFNAWKKTEDAGRVFTVDTEGTIDTVVTGLAWRAEMCQQVFEEAAADLGKGLKAWSDSRCGKRKGKRVGFPRFKKKIGAAQSFRLRNKHRTNKPSAIRVGDDNRPRSITLPGIGQIGVHDDTRRLRRMLTKNRAKILFVTVTQHAGRWWVSLNVEADDLHPAQQHPLRPEVTGAAGSVLTAGCRRLWWPPAPMVQRSTASPMHRRRWPLASTDSGGWRNRCRASRKDHATAVTRRPSSGVTTITSPTSGATSCTRSPTRWSRPTTSSSSRT